MIGNNPATVERHPMYVHEFAKTARVFCGDHIRRGKDIQRTEGDVTRRADRGCNKVQSGGQPDLQEIHHWTRFP